MSAGCTIPEEQLCGCCAGLTQETPLLITNRPALNSISYRAGTYSSFYRSILASLSDPELSSLIPLRTRDSSDFTIALLDAWAICLDVLTFYQERFANEAFLRTAVDSRSVFELARLVGYVPSPGVAASAVVAFTLTSANGSPDKVLIPSGTRVQSIPGPGQKPQVFETSSDLTAMIGWNALPAQTKTRWQLNRGDSSTWIAGPANKINVGDALLFVAMSDGQVSASGPADIRYVSRVVIDAASGDTQLWWNAPLTNTGLPTTESTAVYVLRKKTALFGATAINPFLLPATTLANIPGHPSGVSIALQARARSEALPIGSIVDTPVVGRFRMATDWEFQYAGGGVLNLDAAVDGLAPSGAAPDQLHWVVLTGSAGAAAFQLQSASESNPNLYAVTAKTSQLTLSSFVVAEGSPGTTLDDILKSFIDATRSTTAWVSSDLLNPASVPITQWIGPQTFKLAPGMIAPVEGQSVAIIGGQGISPHVPIGVSGKRARLQVSSGDLALFSPNGSSGYLAVSDGQVFNVSAFPPQSDSTGLLNWSVTTLSGIGGTLSITAENLQLQPADKNDPIASEAALIDNVEVAGDVTTLTLHSPLTGIYDAATTAVNANAIEATHGETMQEILGSGDATNGALQFALKQAPLTYISAATGNGSQSTLQVWINNLRWHEVSDLLAAGPGDRVFVTRVNPQGSRTVQFGNGIQGTRTPTGQMNIRAVYRKGLGSAGMVNPNQLAQLLDRPQGVKAVTNPSAASGGADPATSDEARASAPLPTLTVGRVVSLEDYQNFALNFAGIAKAIATWTWFGTRRGVFLTVAGANGSVLSTDDPVVLNLVAAIRSAGNPFVPLQVASYMPVPFEVGARVKVDTANYDSDMVLAQVWANLQDAFAFNLRQLAQNVVASEIISIIQNTAGVIAAQIVALNLSGSATPGTVPARLCASGPTPPQGAQMLLLDTASQGAIGGWQ